MQSMVGKISIGESQLVALQPAGSEAPQHLSADLQQEMVQSSQSGHGLPVHKDLITSQATNPQVHKMVSGFSLISDVHPAQAVSGGQAADSETADDNARFSLG